MSNLTKKDVLNYLKKEHLLYKAIEEEDDKGVLKQVGVKVNSLEQIIKGIQTKDKIITELIKTLKSKIMTNEGGYYYWLVPDMLIKDKAFYFDKPVFFLDCGALTFMSNYFTANNLGKNESIITVTGKKKK